MEKARAHLTKLRPRWNGLFNALLPRLATIGGAHLWAGHAAGSFLVSVVLKAMMVAYWIVLLIQLRRVMAKGAMTSERRKEVGLLWRINLSENFEFDCLDYSNVYYPLMNYTRIIIYFLVLANYSYPYLAFGAPIFAQLLVLMIDVSSPAFLRGRDRLLNPLQNFLMVLVHIGKGDLIQL